MRRNTTVQNTTSLCRNVSSIRAITPTFGSFKLLQMSELLSFTFSLTQTHHCSNSGCPFTSSCFSLWQFSTLEKCAKIKTSFKQKTTSNLKSEERQLKNFKWQEVRMNSMTRSVELRSLNANSVFLNRLQEIWLMNNVIVFKSTLSLWKLDVTLTLCALKPFTENQRSLWDLFPMIGRDLFNQLSSFLSSRWFWLVCLELLFSRVKELLPLNRFKWLLPVSSAAFWCTWLLKVM